MGISAREMQAWGNRSETGGSWKCILIIDEGVSEAEIKKGGLTLPDLINRYYDYIPRSVYLVII